MSAPDGLAVVVATQGRLQALEALRDLLAEQIQDTDSARDVAALSQRLMDVLEQVDSLASEQQKAGVVSAVDEIARRRVARTGASDPGGSAGGADGGARRR